MKKNRFTRLTVAGLRHSLICRPLAVLMIILTLPSLSWMVGGGQFVAQAQVQGCFATTNRIIQNYCTATVGNHLGNNYSAFLVRLEDDAVNAYLAAHNLPEADAHVIYDYGRADLRNAIRGQIISILLGVIKTPESLRTGQQRALYLWLQDLVWANEIAYYTKSYDEFLTWQHDPCHYVLDAPIADQYRIVYNGAAFCGVSQSSIFNTVVPAPSYFKAVGLKKSYQAWGDKLTCPVGASGVPDKSCNVAFVETTAHMQEVAGIAIAAGTIVTAAVSGTLAASFASAQAAYWSGFQVVELISNFTSLSNLIIDNSAAIVSSILSGGADILSAGSAVALIVANISVGILAGVKTFESQQSLDELNDLKNQITAVAKTPPDLTGMVSDTTGRGLLKIENTVMPRTLKTNADGTLVDRPSTAPLPGHRLGTDLEFVHALGTPGYGSTYSMLTFKGWNGEVWSAQTWGGWFVQTCANGTKIGKVDGTCIQSDSVSGDLHYVDSRLQQKLNSFGLGLPAFDLSRFSAARFGSQFFATRAAGRTITELAPPGNTMSACPVYPQNSVSLNGSGYCWTYVDFELPVVAGDGSDTVAVLTNGLSPAFTSPSVIAFGPGSASTQTITVQGAPTPNLCFLGTNMPSGIQFGDSSSSWLGADSCFKGTLDGGFGTASIQLKYDGLGTSSGNYFLRLGAVNNFGVVHRIEQVFTIKVTPDLSIVSPDTMNVTSGVPAKFTVVATGVPAPSLSVDGVDLGGMTFTDNGNGTATISGIDSNSVNVLTCFISGGTGGVPCGIIATNSQGTYRQPFRVNVTPAPPGHIDCSLGCGTTFHAGAPNEVLLSAAGATTPVSWSFFDSGTTENPFYPWVSLRDNGDGTAVLSGTPPSGTTGTFELSIVAGAQYANNPASHYTITVVDDAVFTSANSAAYDAGVASSGTAGAPSALAVRSMAATSAATENSFTVAANTGTISLGTLVPKGLSFASFGNTATISGNPAAGTGGQYILRLSDDGGTAGTADQQFILNVNEAPKITTAGTATMFVATPGLFAVTTTGFPSISRHAMPANPLPPTNPADGDGMFFTVTGLPASLHASNLNPVGFATGTLTIEGTPAAADIGMHQVQITAQNGFGTPARQTLLLNIVGITGPAPASGTTCNGNYNGTFTGPITVSAGQNCAFYSGGVTGNITVNGGNLALTNTTVTGNMAIQGGSAFSIGPGTTISGNLAIGNVASGSSTSRICEARVGGNLQVTTNAIPIVIGQPEASCGPNYFGKNVDILGNTAAIAVNANTVGKNLTCSQNASISGSGNTADKKTGQCSDF